MKFDPGGGGGPPVLGGGRPAPTEPDGAAGEVAKAHGLQHTAGPDLAARACRAGADPDPSQVQAHHLEFRGEVGRGNAKDIVKPLGPGANDDSPCPGQGCGSFVPACPEIATDGRGLRSRAELLSMIADAGLTIIDRLDTVPTHSRAQDSADPLHAARSAEVTSLWRLRPRA
jgi:hypothetical protein